MNRPDFIQSSGFAVVCTACGTHRKPAAPNRLSALGSALLAILIGTTLAAVLFIGLSGGFRS